jgi:hypothetical protein
MLTVGIFLAGTGAWTSSVISSPSSAHAPAGAARRGPPLVWANLSFLAFMGALGLTLGLAPVTVFVARESTYGSLDPLVIASGYAALLAYLAGGYLVGCILPTYLAVPIALAVAYAMVFMSSAVTSPVLEFDVISGLAVPTRVSVVRLLYFVACAGGALLAAGLWLRMRSTVEFRGAAISVGVVVAPLVVVAYASASYGGPLVGHDSATPLCDKTAIGSLVCVHPARSEFLEPLTASVESIRQAAGPEIFPSLDVFDATLAVPDDIRNRAVLLQIQGQSEDWLSSARTDLAIRASGLEMCYQRATPDPGPQDVSSAVAAWILSRIGESTQSMIYTAGAAEQLETLNRLGPVAARQAIVEEIGAISRCSGTSVT